MRKSNHCQPGRSLLGIGYRLRLPEEKTNQYYRPAFRKADRLAGNRARDQQEWRIHLSMALPLRLRKGARCSKKQSDRQGNQELWLPEISKSKIQCFSIKESAQLDISFQLGAVYLIKSIEKGESSDLKLNAVPNLKLGE